MNLVVDTHTHTISSGHAYSTITENAKVASRKGIKMIAMTDHGPFMEGAPPKYHFSNLRTLPDEIEGVRILKGAECNIVDYDGTIDLEERILRRLDFVMVSFHDICINPSTIHDHTEGMTKALMNPYVDAVAHPGNPVFQVDIEKIVLCAKQYNKFIEINNQSALVRKGSQENCIEFIRLCKKHEVMIVCGSDAHFSDNIGNFDNVLRMINEVGIPERLVMNTSDSNFESYLIEKKRRIQKNQRGC